MKRLATGLGILTLLLLNPPVTAQEVRLPPEVRGPVGLPITIVPLHVDGGEPKWKLGTGLNQLDLSSLFDLPPGTKQRGVAVYGSKDGTFEVWSWNAKGDIASPLSVCKVVVGSGTPVPTPAPVPPPVPPGPTPTPPTPPTPSAALIDLPGLAVLIVEESGDRTKLTPEQRNYIFSTEDFHALLREKCVKDTSGKTAWRIWDKDDIVTGAPPEYQKAFNQVPRNPFVPWMIVSNPRKGGGWQGPLPLTKAEIQAKVLQFAD